VTSSSVTATRSALTRLRNELDAVGRLTSDDRPLIDEYTLMTMLAGLAGSRTADQLVAALRALPDPELRSADDPVVTVAAELSWFDLATCVTIFDPEPGLRTTVDATGSTASVMRAVRDDFPGLELELLDPQGLPVRIHQAEVEGELGYLLGRCARHLGWWGALVGSILAAGTAIVRDADADETGWPLTMLLLCTAVGDWTLTIAAECMFAPVD
jgi:hypothetical protein